MLESHSQIGQHPISDVLSSALGNCAHEIRLAIHVGDSRQARSLLLDAKTQIPSGEWHRWVEEWICITPRRAQQLMRTP